MMNKTKTKKTSSIALKMENYRALSGRDKRRWWLDLLVNNALYIILVLLVIYVTIQQPRFVSVSSLIDILKRSASSLIMALGVGGIIVLTGTDLSAGRILGLTACIAASLLQKADYSNKMFPEMGQWAIPAVILLVIIIGAVVGFINGFFVHKFSLHPFIVTLGTQLILFGTVLIYVNLGTNAGQPISGLSNEYSNFVKGSVLSIGGNPIPNYVWYAIAIAILMWVVWNKTVLGKNMYAVGANPEAANVSGVNVGFTIIAIFTMAGALYGFSGFLESARIASNSASTGVNYELDAIAACVIGGVSFTGGVGKISGIVTGVILLQIIKVALQWLSVSTNLQYIITGLVILIAVSLDMQKYLAKK